MANKFVIKNGLLVDGRVDVTGSINLSQGISSLGGFTGSLVGTASYATYALNASIDTGSFVQNSSTASFVTNSQTGSFVTNSQTGSFVVTSTLNNYVLNTATSSFVVSSTLNNYVLNTATSSFITNSQTGSYAKTNVSNTFTAAQTFNSDVIINATASISYLNVIYQTASVIYSSGSNQIGDDTSDIQSIVGVVKISGSLEITGSVAQGGGTSATGEFAHAQGYLTIASGQYSHAEGSSTTAQGTSAHAEGRSTSAAGSWSHAEGQNTIAEGSYSHAEGYYTIAYGTYSHAGGVYTVASGSGQTVFGTFNTPGDSTSLFIIGNGTSQGSESDILRVTANDVQITGSLKVTDKINAQSIIAEFTGSLLGSASYADAASIDGITGLGTNVATFLKTPSSANLASAVTDETGTGALVFANTPTLTTPDIGAATGTSLTLQGDLISSNVFAAGTVSGSNFSIVTNGGFATTYIDKANVLAGNTLDLFQLDPNAYPLEAVFVRYVIYNSNAPAYTNMRAGTLIIVTDVSNGGTTAHIAETATQDIGNTSTADFQVSIGGGALNLTLDLTASSDNYRVIYEYTLIK